VPHFYFTFLYQIRSSRVAGHEALKQLYKEWVDFIVFNDVLSNWNFCSVD